MEPPAFAVMFAAWVVLTAAAVATNETFDAPAGIVTDPGTDSAASSLLSVTVRPPLGALEPSVRVHAVLPAPVIDWFAQASDRSPCTFLAFNGETTLAAEVSSPAFNVVELVRGCCESEPMDAREPFPRSVPIPSGERTKASSTGASLRAPESSSASAAASSETSPDAVRDIAVYAFEPHPVISPVATIRRENAARAAACRRAF